MHVLNQSALLQVLGWSLLNSIWQMGLCWLVYMLLTANRKRFTPGKRHGLALIALLTGSAWFILSSITQYLKIVHPEKPVQEAFIPFNQTHLSGLSWPASLLSIFPWLSCIYLISVFYLFLRFYIHYRCTRNLLKSDIRKLPPELRIFIQKIASQLGIKKEIKAWFSDQVDTPLTLGFLKPVILLPVAALNHLSTDQAEAIILHELEHIRRNDFLVNMMVVATDIILFFNPFSRLLIEELKKERELSCDDRVLQFRYTGFSYAHALLLLEQRRYARHGLELAATGSDRRFLLNRVKRILNQPRQESPANFRMIAWLFLFLIAGFIKTGTFKSRLPVETEPRFEASKPSVSMNSYNASTEPSGLLKNAISPLVEDKSTDKPYTGSSTKDRNSYPRIEAEDESAEWLNPAEQILIPVENLNREQSLAFFSDHSRPVEFSLIENPAAIPEQSFNKLNSPFIPSSSFEFQLMEDTDKVKEPILNEAAQQAALDLEKSLKALEAINWTELMAELNKKDFNMVTLQESLKKALGNVNWQKIDLEMNKKNLHLAKSMLEQLQKHVLQKQVEEQMQQQFRQQIIEQRLLEKGCTPLESNPELKKPLLPKKARKVIVI